MSEPNIHHELADGLDAALLSILKNGQTVIDNTTGEPVIISPTAAMLNVIRGRLKDLNISTSNPQGATGDLLKAAALHNLRIAPVTDEADLATGT